MKKVVFLLTFFFALGLTAANAQSCSGMKPCCAAKAAKAASADPTIEKRTADDGSVAYVRKETDASGSVKFVSIQYDEVANAFVNVAPKSMESTDKAACTKKSAAACSEKKACCAGGAAAGKACCAGDKAKASSTSSTEQQ